MRNTNQDVKTIYRKDYVAPGYWVDTVEMGFDLHPQRTHVATRPCAVIMTVPKRLDPVW